MNEDYLEIANGVINPVYGLAKVSDYLGKKYLGKYGYTTEKALDIAASTIVPGYTAAKGLYKDYKMGKPLDYKAAGIDLAIDIASTIVPVGKVFKAAKLVMALNKARLLNKGVDLAKDSYNVSKGEVKTEFLKNSKNMLSENSKSKARWGVNTLLSTSEEDKKYGGLVKLRKDC